MFNNNNNNNNRISIPPSVVTSEAEERFTGILAEISAVCV